MTEVEPFFHLQKGYAAARGNAAFVVTDSSLA
jgi:hypothetical protein